MFLTLSWSSTAKCTNVPANSVPIHAQLTKINFTGTFLMLMNEGLTQDFLKPALTQNNQKLADRLSLTIDVRQVCFTRVCNLTAICTSLLADITHFYALFRQRCQVKIFDIFEWKPGSRISESESDSEAWKFFQLNVSGTFCMHAWN